MANDSTTEHKREWATLKEDYADAIWAWGHVEAELWTVYVASVGATHIDLRPLNAAFFALNSFESRLVMTHAAMKKRWDKKPLFNAWCELRERCDKASGERGRIAHRVGFHIPKDKPHQHDLYILTEALWHSKRPLTWGEAKSTGIDSKQLTQFGKKWHRLYYDLNQFALALWHQDLLPASSSQPVDPSPPQSRKGDPRPIKPSSPSGPSRE